MPFRNRRRRRRRSNVGVSMVQHNLNRRVSALAASSLSQLALVQSNDFTQDSGTAQDQADTANRDAIVKIGATVTRLELDLIVGVANASDTANASAVFEWALVDVGGRDLDGSALIRDLTAANVAVLSLRSELGGLLPR